MARFAPAAALLATVALFAAAPAPARAGEAERTAAVVRKLQTQRLSRIKLEEVSLEGLAKYLRVATGVNIYVKRHALVAAGIDPDAIALSVELEDVTVATLLETLLEPHEIAIKVRGNLVQFTSRADAQGPLTTRLYAISHITYRKVDFVAPDINLTPSGFTADDYEPEVVVEDDPLASGDAVADLVRDLVEPGKWDEYGWTLRATDKYLVVRAPARVHAQVFAALDQIASLK